ncbi:2-polyprenyl-6-methoxyphenol hydroxylase [Streptomyces aidingensis]|uniref:2-polyprenyl-6-methoxyphenol hydroxylase n=1 Tax=Streptomyces aidingensis TaxID=910347 RepID=A0A1I1LCB6_9ACTN|nr:2-polyprenyl-6-methoxyphenol hydroxylase [Streptomyces aidingensis]
MIGGGIGGLAAVLALRRSGIRAAAYERTRELRAERSGHGLILWHNAVLALRAIGFDKPLDTVGHPIGTYRFRAAADRTLARWDLGPGAERYNAPVYAVSRPALHRALAEEVGEDLHTGARCVALAQDDDGVVAGFEDGREVRAAVVVGADGLRSAVRRTLMPYEPPPRYAGYTAFQGVVHLPGAAEPGVFTNTFGAGKWFVHYPLADGHVYWDGILDERTARRLDAFGMPAKSMLAQEFAGWPDPVPALIGASAAERLAPVDIFDRDPVPRWTSGRVTLLGDAAHPMTFNLGQGVGQALEDAVVLARCLAGDDGGPAGDPAAALLAYQRRRLDRTTRIVRRSRANGTFIRRRSPVMCRLRDTFVRVAFERLVFGKTYGLTMDTDF